MKGDNNKESAASSPTEEESATQASRQSDETKKCKTCNKADCYVKNTRGEKQKFGSKFLCCDLCKEWFHGICQNLTNAECTTLDKMDRKHVRWFCSECVAQVDDAINGKINGENDGILGTLAHNVQSNSKLDTIENLVRKISQHNDALLGRVDKLEKSYAEATKSNADSIQRSMEVNSSAKAILEKDIEKREADNRKNNAIIYGVKEMEGKTALEVITEMMKEDCFQRTNGPVRAIRLQTSGSNDTSKPKPMKLEFKDEYSKWEFLKRANAALRNENIFCKLDESKQKRDLQYSLRQKIKQMKESGADADQEYRIRNHRIQSRSQQAQGEWKFLNMRVQAPSANTTV